MEDIFRTMSTGLSGTPMPSYRDSLSESDRWALAYYILSLSAFTDPLTGEPLPIASADRTALNDPKLEASTPEDAYVPGEREKHSAAVSGSTSAELAPIKAGGGAASQNNR